MPAPVSNVTADHFHLHNLALSPLLEDSNTRSSDILGSIPDDIEGDFTAFLIYHGLAPLWYNLLKDHETVLPDDARFIKNLRRVYLTASATYLLQKNTLKKINNLFQANDIKYATFKGAHTREIVYDQPDLRPATDLDILIPYENRDEIIKLLVNNDLRFIPDKQSFSHEATLVDGAVSIDLHWDILRPGRTAKPMGDLLLKNVVDMSWYSGMGDDESLFIMLVHPAFTKHVCSETALLIRVLDLYKWLVGRDINWDRVLYYLEVSETKTAAWATLIWLCMLTNIELPKDIIKSIQPGLMKKSYLQFWIGKNLPARLGKNMFLKNMFFTLFLHDNISGTLHSAWAMRKAKKSTTIPDDIMELSGKY